MSNSKLMDTAPGGESTQYGSINTVDVPTAKQGGQMGTPSDGTADDDAASAERGAKTADNIRYGQNISESGQGGMTTTSSGSANDSGYGDIQDQAAQSSDAAEDSRNASGYGGSQDMDNSVGG